MSEGRDNFINRFIRKTNELPPVENWLDKRGEWLVDNAKIREYLRPMIEAKGEKIKILSIGSGKGHEMDWLDSVLEGVEIKGLDPNDFWTKPVQKRVSSSDKFGGNTVEYLSPEVKAQDLVGIKDDSVDAATMFFVMHHINKEEHDASLQELNRVMKEGGLAFVAEDIVDSETERKQTEKQDRILNAEFSDHGPHNYRSVQEWADFFKKHGFEVVEYNEVKPEKVRNGFFVLRKPGPLKEKE